MQKQISLVYGQLASTAPLATGYPFFPQQNTRTPSRGTRIPNSCLVALSDQSAADLGKKEILSRASHGSSRFTTETARQCVCPFPTTPAAPLPSRNRAVGNRKQENRNTNSHVEKGSREIFRSGWCVHACAKTLQLCPTLLDHTDGSPPGSSVHGIPHGIPQARILEWVTTPSSRGSS